MPDPSNSSFIPKRGPAQRKKGRTSKQLYVFTIISYVLLFSTLLASGGIYFYARYVEGQLATEVAALDAEIKSFSEDKMKEVLAFDLRLAQALGRINNSVSLGSIFKALEAATIDTVQISSLSMTRDADVQYTLEAEIKTDSFDSTLFQRQIYSDNETLSGVAFTDLNASRSTTENESDGVTDSVVTFSATLSVPIEQIPYEAVSDGRVPLTITPDPVPVVEDAVVDEEAVLSDESNEAVINENGV